MQSQYKAVLALLDREVLVTGAAHDLRSALTAARGRLEIREDGMPPELEPTFDRLDTLARVIDAVGGGQTPESALDAALDALSATGRTWRLDGDRRLDTLAGVHGTGFVRPWGLALAQEWRAEQGAALAGARVRVAARLVGASCGFVADADGVHGTLTVRRAAG